LLINVTPRGGDQPNWSPLFLVDKHRWNVAVSVSEWMLGKVAAPVVK